MGEQVDEEVAILTVIAAVEPAQFRRLRSLADQLRSDPASAGQWTELEHLDDGALMLPQFGASEVLMELSEALYEAGLITPVFDWPTWWATCPYQEGQQIDAAPATDLVRFITAVVRGDRFTEGALDRYVSNGSLPAAVLRLATAALDESPSAE